MEKREEKKEKKKTIVETTISEPGYDAGSELELDESKRIFRANTPFYMHNDRRMVRQYLSPLVRDLKNRKDLKIIINIQTTESSDDSAAQLPLPPYPFEDVLRDRANTLRRELEDMGLDKDQLEIHNEFDKERQTIKFKIKKK